MDHTLALIGRAHQGDKEARDTLFAENMGLVYSVTRRFLGRGVEMEDLFQIGSIGLLKAVDKFNPEFDVKFSTYAVPMIVGEIKRFLRDDGILKVSRSIKENQYKIYKVLRWTPFIRRCTKGTAQTCSWWTGFRRKRTATRSFWIRFSWKKC